MTFGLMNHNGEELRDAKQNRDPRADASAQAIWRCMSTAFWMRLVLLVVTIGYAILMMLKPVS